MSEHYDLGKINAERLRRKLPLLNQTQANQALAARRGSADDGFDVSGFLIGYTTGVPIGLGGVTAGAIMGAVLHAGSAAADQPAAREPDPAPSYSEPSRDDSSSSYSSDSGSSYSSDSGSGGGGGSFD